MPRVTALNPSTTAFEIHRRLLAVASARKKETQKKFFKTYPGSYGESDEFLGVTVPELREIAKDFKNVDLLAIGEVLGSKFNEERLLALIILVDLYNGGDAFEKEKYYRFYANNLKSVNNWNLVDASAHPIMGAHLFDKDKTPLKRLAVSNDLWERRVAIVSTWFFIKNDLFAPTLEIAEILLGDERDLIHKSVGWMLRELGKKNEGLLVGFLKNRGAAMPRTTLRYAIEKFPDETRKKYLTETKNKEKNR